MTIIHIILGALLSVQVLEGTRLGDDDEHTAAAHRDLVVGGERSQLKQNLRDDINATVQDGPFPKGYNPFHSKLAGKVSALGGSFSAKSKGFVSKVARGITKFRSAVSGVLRGLVGRVVLNVQPVGESLSAMKTFAQGFVSYHQTALRQAYTFEKLAVGVTLLAVGLACPACAGAVLMYGLAFTIAHTILDALQDSEIEKMSNGQVAGHFVFSLAFGAVMQVFGFGITDLALGGAAQMFGLLSGICLSIKDAVTAGAAAEGAATAGASISWDSDPVALEAAFDEEALTKGDDVRGELGEGEETEIDPNDIAFDDDEGLEGEEEFGPPKLTRSKAFAEREEFGPPKLMRSKRVVAEREESPPENEGFEETDGPKLTRSLAFRCRAGQPCPVTDEPQGQAPPGSIQEMKDLGVQFVDEFKGTFTCAAVAGAKMAYKRAHGEDSLSL